MFGVMSVFAVSGVQYGRLESNVTLECGKSEIG